MFTFSGCMPESIESTERIIAKLDEEGRSNVEHMRQARLRSVRAVRKASMERGTYHPSHDRVTDIMIESVVRKEAKLQTLRLAKKNKNIEDRMELRKRARFEQTEEYRQQCLEVRQACREEMEKFAFSMF